MSGMTRREAFSRTIVRHDDPPSVIPAVGGGDLSGKPQDGFPITNVGNAEVREAFSRTTVRHDGLFFVGGDYLKQALYFLGCHRQFLKIS